MIESGIYVVYLKNAQLVPVTQDLRYVDKCAQVRRGNVKVGKAKDFAAREKHYLSDFGRDNVVFEPIAATAEIVPAEKAVLAELKKYRMPSPKGGRLEWLEGISKDEVVARAMKALDKAKIYYEAVARTD